MPVSCSCGPHAQWADTELAPGLAASRCKACDGVSIAMAQYRPWRAGKPTDIKVETVPEAQHGQSVRNCATCGRMMHRYRVGLTPDFRIDHCPDCQRVWLDSGEWELIAQAGLALRLDEIVTDAWQRRVRADELSALREAALRSRHGDACIDELRRVRAWLDTQPQREELVALLRAGW